MLFENDAGRVCGGFLLVTAVVVAVSVGQFQARNGGAHAEKVQPQIASLFMEADDADLLQSLITSKCFRVYICTHSAWLWCSEEILPN